MAGTKTWKRERENQVIAELQGPMMAGGWRVRTGRTGGDAEVSRWPGQKGLAFRHLSMKRV